MTEFVDCHGCGGAGPLCQDGYCRACHVALSFEDCTDGTWSAERLLENGHSIEEVRALYPDARLPRVLRLLDRGIAKREGKRS